MTGSEKPGGERFPKQSVAEKMTGTRSDRLCAERVRECWGGEGCLGEEGQFVEN